MNDADFLARMRGILKGTLCACAAPTMDGSDSCEECASALRSHCVRGQWFALPNGIGSDVGPFASAAEAERWVEGRGL